MASSCDFIEPRTSRKTTRTLLCCEQHGARDSIDRLDYGWIRVSPVYYLLEHDRASLTIMQIKHKNGSQIENMK